jgi:hypothetical protein
MLADELLHTVGDSVGILGEGISDGAKFAVVEVEKDWRLDAEFSASADGFGATRSGEGFTGRNFGEVGGSFFAFGGNGEIDADAFPAKSRCGQGSRLSDGVGNRAILSRPAWLLLL